MGSRAAPHPLSVVATLSAKPWGASLGRTAWMRSILDPMKRASILGLVLTTCALMPSLASARRRATAHQRAAVIAAAVAAHDINAAQAPCVRVYISTVTHDWASMDFLYPTPKACHEPANGISLFHRAHGHWRFITAGSSFSCPISGVPRGVARDLRVSCFNR